MAGDGDSFAPRFDDLRNIHVGDARVIWAKETRPVNGMPRSEGWVLPGGRRTTDRDEARSVATQMNRILRG